MIGRIYVTGGRLTESLLECVWFIAISSYRNLFLEKL